MIRGTIAGVTVLAVTWMLLAPSETFENVELFPGEDKAVHCALFLVLAWLVRWAFPGHSATGTGALAAGLAVYAFGIETVQPLLTGGDRKFEWLDMACNFTGVVAGWLLYRAAAARAATRSSTGGCGAMTPPKMVVSATGRLPAGDRRPSGP